MSSRHGYDKGTFLQKRILPDNINDYKMKKRFSYEYLFIKAFMSRKNYLILKSDKTKLYFSYAKI